MWLKEDLDFLIEILCYELVFSISGNCLFCRSLTESLGFAMKPYEFKTVFQLNIFLIDTIY